MNRLLMQIGKIDPLPVIVLGGKFCNAMRDFVFNTMIKEGVIGEEDLGLLCEASLAEEVVPLIQARMEQILVLGVIGSKKGCQLLLLTEPGCLRLGHKSRKDN